MIILRNSKTVSNERFHLFSNLIDDNYNLINKNTDIAKFYNRILDDLKNKKLKESK